MGLGALTQPFSSAYAQAYDAFYADKDYDGECDLLEESFRRFAQGPVEHVLDLGCGTGGHALRLASRGYRVTGVDRSPGMLAAAREKAAETGLDVELREGDVRTVELGARFDAALLLFAVLSYQLENDDVLATLRTARRHLRPGGVLVLDVWHGPGVLVDPPGERTKRVLVEGRAVERRASALLDVRRHLCTVRYALSDDAGAKTEETHVVRYFFPRELELQLELAGFETVVLAPAGSLDGEPDESTWNVLVVGVAT